MIRVTALETSLPREAPLHPRFTDSLGQQEHLATGKQGWILKCQPQHMFLLPVAPDMIKTLAGPFLKEHLTTLIHPPQGQSCKTCYGEGI